jgi:hypothetical protein
MLRTMSEADSKVFRELREVALERFCARVLAEVARLAADESRTSHERHLAVFQLIKEQDEELALGFDSPRRSTAMQQLLFMRSRRLLADEEMARFSDETRNIFHFLLDQPAD